MPLTPVELPLPASKGIGNYGPGMVTKGPLDYGPHDARPVGCDVPNTYNIVNAVESASSKLYHRMGCTFVTGVVTRQYAIVVFIPCKYVQYCTCW